MSLRFRHSASLFPGVRLNLSGSGASVSFGVPGATLNVGPRGAAATVGIPGTCLSYRVPLSPPRQMTAPATPKPPSLGSGLDLTAPPTSPIGEIRSATVESLTSGTLVDLKRLLIEAHSRQAVLTKEFQQCVSARDNAYRAHWFGIRFPRYPLLRYRVPALKKELAIAQAELEAKGDALSGCYARLTFTLNEQMKMAWQGLRDAHTELSRSRAIWDITSSIANDRVKSRSIARRSVDRKPVSLSGVYSEREIISAQYGAFRFGNANGGSLDFYPGVCMIRGGMNDFALIDIMDIEVEFIPRRFVEEENVPADAQVVSKTWKKTNVDGSRDRRFVHNYEIPVTLYGELFVRSTSGINEAYMFSSAIAAAKFADAFAGFKHAIKDMPSRPNDAIDGGITRFGDDAVSKEFGVAIPDPPMLPPVNWKPLAGAALIACGSAATGIYVLRGGAGTAAATWTTMIELASARLPSQISLETPTKPPSAAAASGLPLVTVKTAANVRSGPNQSAAIVRTANARERFYIFDRRNGWIQVGTDRPLGWIAASLLSE